MVAVGLMYQQGYFRQRLNADGWQLELFPRNDFHNMPVTLVRNAEGHPIMIEVDMPGGRREGSRCWLGKLERIDGRLGYWTGRGGWRQRRADYCRRRWKR